MGAPRSLRRCPPAQTFAIARRLMRPLGLSRVVEITRLDTLGLPVCISLRPGGRTLRVHAGKGLDVAAARVGALMEGVEFAAAERDTAAGPDATLPLSTLEAQLPSGLGWRDFAPRLGAPLAPAQAVPAWRCENLLDGRTTLLPAELMMLPGPPGPALFGWSTNGLASGNTLEEATLHALLEVLERDAIAINRVDAAAARVVDRDTLPAPFGALAHAWRRRGVTLFVRHLPSELALPCFEATLHEPGHPLVPLARGWGLHPDRELALARAVGEAAQSRVSCIHRAQPGVDAFYRGRPLRDGGPAAPGAAQRVLSALGEPVAPRLHFAGLPQPPRRSIRGTLRALLAELSARGFGAVYRRRMRADDLLGLQVVKVTVPRCEAALGPDLRMGPRLLQRLRLSPARPA